MTKTMNTAAQAAATQAFTAGMAAHAEGKGLSSRLTIPAGTQRNFWEAGWTKAAKAAAAKFEAERPARIAAAKANRVQFMGVVERSRANAIAAGKRVDKAEAIRIACNALIGVETTYAGAR